MYNLNAKTLATSCDASLSMGKEVYKSNMTTFVFRVSTLGGKLEEMRKCMVISEEVFQCKDSK